MHDSPTCSQGAELSRHALKCGLVGTLIEDQNTALPVSLTPQTREVLVETAAKILKCQFDGIAPALGKMLCGQHKQMI